MPSSNLLALFDTILNRADASTEAGIEEALYKLARSMGISQEVIELALECDRMLVVYEP